MKFLKNQIVKKSFCNRILVFISLLCSAQAVSSQITVSSTTRWIDTHFDVVRGSLIQLSATGTINVGPGLGSYGPNGILAPHTIDFPTDVPYIYGLVARLTSSRTNPNDELRDDWAYGSQTSYCSTSPGHLWLAVNDNNLADNTGQFNVRVDITTCPVIDNSYRSTRVHVVNDFGSDEVGSDVYIDGVFRGRTNNQGMLVLPVQNRGAQIIARKFIYENSTYRSHHNLGSTRDWNYRVYITSMTINNNGTFANTVITEPNDTYTLTVRSSNTLIGVNWLASFEWDASEDDFRSLNDNVIRPASQRLFNATDGQFFVEQISIIDNADFWDDTDFRIFANWSLRENVNRRTGGFLYNNILFGGTWMNMSRISNNYTYAHEFGHYGFDLNDEYEDNSALSCTGNVNSLTSPFGWMGGNFQPTASCMMWRTAPKICSSHFLNPHVTNTNQGSQSCWDHLVQVFRDPIPFTRYSLRTPTTRGQIMGSVGTIPVQDWQPRLQNTNSTRSNLCQDFQVIVTRQDNNEPVADVEVFNNTSYGQTILLGKTLEENSDTPEPEKGTILVKGVHVGDRISASGGSFTVTGCGITTRIVSSGRSKTNELVNKSAYTLPVSTPFKLNVSSVIGGADLKLVFNVTSSVKLNGDPQMQFILTGQSKPTEVKLAWDDSRKIYTGVLPQQPARIQGTVTIKAKDTKGNETTKVQNIIVSAIDPKEGNEIFSDDGEFVVKLPAAAFPGERSIGIFKNDFALPVLGAGEEIISGPYAVALSNNEQLKKYSTIRFQLPEIFNEKKTMSGNFNDAIQTYDAESIRVLYYADGSSSWKTEKGRVIKEVSAVTLPAQGIGRYLLIGKRKVTPSTKTLSQDNARETAFDKKAYLSPNPASKYTTAQFNVKKASRVQVALLDINGNQVSEVINNSFQPGPNSINLKTGHLTKGVYFVRILSGEEVQTLKLLIQ